MQKRRYPQYAIFDMDGTLLDSMGFWNAARGEFLATLGLLPSEAVLSAPLSELPALLSALYGLTLPLQTLRLGIYETVLRHYRTDVVPYRNVVRILRGIVGSGGRAALVTATPHPYADRALRLFGLAECFSAVLAPEDNGGVGKWDPSIFRLALSRLGCDAPALCRVYEDSLYSIRTAREMGFSVTAVLDPSAESDRAEILSLADEAIVPIRETAEL